MSSFLLSISINSVRNRRISPPKSLEPVGSNFATHFYVTGEEEPGALIKKNIGHNSGA